jgi:cyclase|tara:strand:+ start:1308 stop:2090 length:783 start_codon:yes stop_codon:yes gene_type:complete
MLKKRLIPKLIFKTNKIKEKYYPMIVTTKQYNKIKYVGDPISQAKIFESQLTDELFLVNMDSLDLDENKFLLEYYVEFSSKIFMPLTIGGGVKSIESFRKLLQSGADKVCINTLAIEKPEIITEASKRFGSQCVVVSVDFKKHGEEYFVFYKNGKINTKKKLLDWVKTLEQLGAGEIILTDIDRDGMSSGLNIDAANQVTNCLNIPVIISGGCGVAEHFVEAFKKSKVEGISAGNYFSFKDQNILQARSQVLNNGICLRK